ncbi:MAG TPA: MFS transporter [Candidatus Acidoferrum sp.]|nr:MFS transporter [Candidatus Acidoferrum sp.]
MAEAVPSSAVPRSFIGKFTVLLGAVRELWIIFAMVLLSNLAYRMVNFTLRLWLSSDLGYQDMQASFVVLLWSAGLSLCIVLVGSLTDALGLRKTLLLAFGLCIISRVFLTFTTIKWVVLGIGLPLLALGEGMGAPVTVAALRRYTTTAQRSVAFSIMYAIMNGGFLIGVLIFDGLRARLGEHGQFTVPGLAITLSTYRTVILSSLALSVPTFVLIYFWLREGVEATDQGVIITPAKPKYPGTNALQALGLTIRDTAVETCRIFAGLWKQAGFYKFLAFLSLAAFIKMIFVHMDYTYPTWGIRELGEGAPVGHLYGLNNILIVVLAPLVGVLTQRISAYRMVIVGSFIAASSVFIMTVPPQWFRPVADGLPGNLIGHVWLGLTGTVNPYYVMVFLFVLFLSVGEAFYSPRLYEYTAAIAPKGQEASYMAMSYLPFFLAKLPVGPLSGVLLARFCPATGVRHSQTLWLIIGLSTMIAPMGFLVFQRFIRVHEAGRED